MKNILLSALVAPACWAIDCSAGYYTDGTNIFPADPGYYVPVANSATQTACLPGYYTRWMA
jgi:hypothetical protein